MIKKLRMLAVVAGAALLALSVTQAAAAYAASPAGTAAVSLTAGNQASARVAVFSAQPQTALAACNGVPVEAYGYVGCARSNTHALHCAWDEWFVIAPNGTIWHAWPNSGGWKEMPNDGNADDTWNCYRNGNGQRQVEVWTSTPN